MFLDVVQEAAEHFAEFVGVAAEEVFVAAVFEEMKAFEGGGATVEDVPGLLEKGSRRCPGGY